MRITAPSGCTGQRMNTLNENGMSSGATPHFDLRAPTNIEPLDDVDALELRVAVRDRRQVPSPRRCDRVALPSRALCEGIRRQ